MLCGIGVWHIIYIYIKPLKTYLLKRTDSAELMGCFITLKTVGTLGCIETIFEKLKNGYVKAKINKVTSNTLTYS